MPVLVTGAEDCLGRMAVRALLRERGEVRTFLDATRGGQVEAAELREIGCKVAVGELDDEAHLESALTQVHTLVHLWGGPLRSPGDQVQAAATVFSAALGAAVRRVIWVGELASGTGNAYLNACVEVEALLSDLPCETVVLRTALRYGPGDGLTEALADGILSGSGAKPGTPHAPVFAADLAQAIAVADRQRGGNRELHLDVTVTGPERVALGTFLQRLGAPLLTAARPAGVPQPPAWLADLVSRPAVGGPDALGRDGTSLDDGIARVRAGRGHGNGRQGDG